jgi:hypothetical protein
MLISDRNTSDIKLGIVIGRRFKHSYSSIKEITKEQTYFRNSCGIVYDCPCNSQYYGLPVRVEMEVARDPEVQARTGKCSFCDTVYVCNEREVPSDAQSTP